MKSQTQIYSFGFRQGPLPARSTIRIVDVRHLKDPYTDETLRPLDGRHPAVQKFIADQKVAQAILRVVRHALKKGDITGVAFGCHGGRHRSVSMAELLAQQMNVYAWHLDLRRDRSAYSPKAKGDYSHMPAHTSAGFNPMTRSEARNPLFKDLVASAITGTSSFAAATVERISGVRRFVCRQCTTKFRSDVADACPECGSTDIGALKQQ